MIRVCLAIALSIIGCSGDFEPGSRVHDLRLLALRADRPFAHPGERVALELLAPNPQGHAIAWAKATCTLPPSSTIEGCLGALDAELTPFDPAVDALAIDVPDDVLDDLPSSAKPSALIGVVVVACPGVLHAGRTESVPIECRDADDRALPIGELEVGMKRIFVRERDRNANPEITRVLLDGKPWREADRPEVTLCESESYEIEDCPGPSRHTLSVDVDAAEHGHDEQGSDFSEQVVVQLYVSHGVLRDDVRVAGAADTVWAAQPVGGEKPEQVTLWVVARDNRGGVSWAERRARVRIP